MFRLDDLPGALYEPSNAPLLTGILRGVERETLRSRFDGSLAQSSHPMGLGSALTHPQITTDFSEALLEFITPPSHRIDDVLGALDQIHRYVHMQLPDDEMLWYHSMPCTVSEPDIPVARYGSSNIGQMKTVYRLGLGYRYGRVMQTVAGVHYNFSLPDAFWAYLHAHENSTETLTDFRTRRYIDMIRNFRRHYWVLIYLFGASPAVSRSFVQGREHDLDVFEHDQNTLFLPFATSLRMGDLGYQSRSQEDLYICYNRLNTYVQTLISAINTPYPPYERVGTRDRDGNFRQLNTSLLQIENEFYSPIRPKRTARTGETALTALCHRGVEYVEVRCLDLDPYNPLGINREQMLFLDVFLLYCLLQHSPQSNREECEMILTNQKRVVTRGREPGLILNSQRLGELHLTEWGGGLMQALEPIAELLDSAHRTDEYGASLRAHAEKFTQPELTPSARVLSDMRAKQCGFSEFARTTSVRHSEQLRQKPLSGRSLTAMRSAAKRSLAEQTELEAADSLDFESYLQRYYAQYKACECPPDQLISE